MNKIGLKIWSSNIDYYFDCAKELYEKKVYDYIELFVVPDTINNIAKWKSLNIPFDIHATHFIFGVNLSKQEKFDFNYKKYLDVKKYADELNANIIVFHGGINGDYKETARQLREFNDKRILIENLPRKLLKMSESDFSVGSYYDELKYIMDYVHCGFCLDIGHAICSANTKKINPYDYIKKLFTLNPSRIHLSDKMLNNEYDEHMNFGKGEVDFVKIFSMIPNSINITIETDKKSKYNLDDFCEDAMFIKNIIKIKTK